MASLEWLMTRKELAKGDVRQVGTDTPIAIRLAYKGTGSVTSVTVTTATNIVMITSDGGTDTYAFSTYDTIGKLVDQINSDGIFQAKVLDSIRSEATASQFVTGVVASSTEDGETYYDVKVDTNAANYFAVRISQNRGFNGIQGKNHRIDVYEIKYLIDLATASANNFKIYKIAADGITETVVLQEIPVDNTLTTVNFSNGETFISSDEGGDIVVKIDDAGTLADSTGNFLRVIAKIL